MAKLKYSYDVELYSTKSGKRLRVVHEGISGAKLKEFRKSIKSEMIDNREFRIYKNTVQPTGNKSKILHDKVTFGLQDNIQKAIGDYDFQYTADVDYEYDRRCRDGCDGQYCSCSTIERAQVESIDIDYVSSCLTKKVLDAIKPFKLNIDRKILEYCLDRFFRLSGLKNPENYYVHICCGYYGDEIDRVAYEGDLVSAVCNMLHGSSLDALKFVLELEYGYLLSYIENCAKECYILSGVLLGKLEIPNTEHYVKLDKELVKKYESYELPIGVYRLQGPYMNGKDYRLVDGYHRLKAAQNAGKKICDIIIVH